MHEADVSIWSTINRRCATTVNVLSCRQKKRTFQRRLTKSLCACLSCISDWRGQLNDIMMICERLRSSKRQHGATTDICWKNYNEGIWKSAKLSHNLTVSNYSRELLFKNTHTTRSSRVIYKETAHVWMDNFWTKRRTLCKQQRRHIVLSSRVEKTENEISLTSSETHFPSTRP